MTVDAPRHPLFAQLVGRHGFAGLDEASLDGWLAQAGPALLVVVEDPVRVKESLDLAVIAPEIRRAFPHVARAGVLWPTAARAAVARFGVRRFPALVVLRDGGYAGAIEGLRNWDEYRSEVARLLEAPLARPLSIGVAVAARGPAGAPCP